MDARGGMVLLKGVKKRRSDGSVEDDLEICGREMENWGRL